MDYSAINKALVVGLGARTGLYAANFLAKRGLDVCVSDRKSGAELASVSARLESGVRLAAGAQQPALLDEGFDVLVLSPGVPASLPLIQEAVSRGVPVISEVELAFHFSRGLIAAITGTDGKSTTTALAGHIFRAIGIETFIGGNIGVPLISFAEETTEDSVTVAELSSFQLETIDEFRPDAAALLNIAPDHLDRYPDMEDYVDAKCRIAKNQKKRDYFIYNRDDVRCARAAEGAPSTGRSFSYTDNEADIFFRDDTLLLRDNGKENIILDTRKMRIMGSHNVENAMAALLLVDAVLKKKGEKPEWKRIADAVYSFTGLPHRLERIGSFEGRLFINDSKATTVGAVETAIRSIEGKGVLICGGRTKGDDYSRLAGPASEKIRGVVLIGESREEFSRVFERFSQRTADGLDDAVCEAMKLSVPGDTILLSPACASFDMFENYEERGDIFRESCEKLKRGELSWT